MNILFILLLLVLITFVRGHPPIRRNKEDRFLGLDIKSKLGNPVNKLFGIFKKSEMDPVYVTEPDVLLLELDKRIREPEFGIGSKVNKPIRLIVAIKHYCLSLSSKF